MNQEAVRVAPRRALARSGSSAAQISGPFSQIDLMPTLLELLGAEPDTPLHGQSRAPLLGGNDTRLEDDVVVSWNEHPDHLEAVARAPAQEWQTEVAGNAGALLRRHDGARPAPSLLPTGGDSAQVLNSGSHSSSTCARIPVNCKISQKIRRNHLA